METNTIQLKTLVVSIALIIPVEIFFGWFLFSHLPNRFLVLGGMRILGMLMLITATIYLEGGLEAIGLTPRLSLYGIKKGLAWSAFFATSVVILHIVLLIAEINALAWIRTPIPTSHQALILFFIVGGIISPVAEEIFFRGILFGFFRRWGATTAVVLSTILFVLPHLKRGAIPVTQMVGGVVFAAAYEKEKSLAAPIIIHSLGNLSIFSLSLMPPMVQ